MENISRKKRWLILLTIVIVTFMSTLDSSIVNVALPVMAHSMNIESSKIQLVVVSYLLIIVATILIFGKLGDMIGKARVFKYGLLIFTIGSLFCGITNSLIMLIFARIIQGIGASACMANNQGIITETFPAEKRGKALGISGTFVALGSMTGPFLGGLITHFSSWHNIFLINVPVGFIALYFAIKILPTEKRKLGIKLDWVGAFLFILTIVPLFYILENWENIKINDITSITMITMSAMSFIFFIIFELNHKSPILHLELFKNKLFSISILCAFISFISIFCSIIILPFYLQDVRKFTPANAGIILMAYPIILAIIAPLSGNLSDKIGSEILTIFGLTITSIGLFLMSTLTETSNIYSLITFIIIMSIGNGMFQSPNNSLVMSQAPKNRLGVAGSINALIRNLGMVFGVALATTLLYDRMSYKAGFKVTTYITNRDDLFIYGMKVVFITAGIISLFGALLTFIRYLSGYKKRVQ